MVWSACRVVASMRACRSYRPASLSRRGVAHKLHDTHVLRACKVARGWRAGEGNCMIMKACVRQRCQGLRLAAFHFLALGSKPSDRGIPTSTATRRRRSRPLRVTALIHFVVPAPCFHVITYGSVCLLLDTPQICPCILYLAFSRDMREKMLCHS